MAQTKVGGTRPTSRATAPTPSTPAPAEAKPALREPVWLVRAVLVLFLVGFAAFLARELRNFFAGF